MGNYRHPNHEPSIAELLIEVINTVERLSTRLDGKFARIYTKLNDIKTGELILMALSAEVQAAFDEASTEISAMTTVEDSNAALLAHLVEMISAIPTNANDPQAIIDAVANLKAGLIANKDRLTADVVANTPAETPPVE